MKVGRGTRIVAGVLATAGGIAAIAAARQPRGTDLFVSGTVEATEAELGFQAPGRLTAIAVREGDEVARGDTVALIDRWELEAQRASAMANVAAARALLAELAAGSRAEEIGRARALLRVATDRRDAARREVSRLEPLAGQALISKQAFDQQQTAADVAESEVARATEELRLLTTGTRPERIAAQRAAVAQAEAALSRVDALLAQSVITAPFAGTVTVRHREPGEAVAPGTPVVTVENLGDRWIRVYVPGDEVGRLVLGGCASISSDGFADRQYGGVISYIARVAEFTPRNVQSTKDRVRLVYEVRVKVTGDDRVDLKPGLPADVRFATDQAGASQACGGGEVGR